MDRAISWAIVMKDFSVFRTKRSIIFSLILFPILIGVGLPAVLWLLMRLKGLEAAGIALLLDAFYSSSS